MPKSSDTYSFINELKDIRLMKLEVNSFNKNLTESTGVMTIKSYGGIVSGDDFFDDYDVGFSLDIDILGYENSDNIEETKLFKLYASAIAVYGDGSRVNVACNKAEGEDVILANQVYLWLRERITDMLKDIGLPRLGMPIVLSVDSKRASGKVRSSTKKKGKKTARRKGKS